MSTLGGSICIRNGDDLDYCWREAVISLEAICDQVVICDGDSTDGTTEAIKKWCAENPKLKYVRYQWPSPCGDNNYWVKWINWAREHLDTDWHFQLDADEIVHEKSYDEIRQFIAVPWRSAFMQRWNFWKDTKHMIPEGYKLGRWVCRIAPSRFWLASDGPHEMGNHAPSIGVRTNIQLYHYGFLRHRESFFKKQRAFQGYYANAYDQRLRKAEKLDVHWADAPEIKDWKVDDEYSSGPHPAVIQGWLKQRGYSCE